MNVTAALKLPPFRPFPLVARPHLQTVLAAKLSLPIAIPSELQTVALEDGDRIALEVSTPPGWRPGDPTVVLIHGLCGCARSSYVVRLARKLHRRGLRAVRMNMRGCGAGKGLARQPYHSGRSEDLLAVVKELRAAWPASAVAVVGFSLGGNIALKLAGELGEHASGLIERVIAVCPPVDLLAASRKLSRPANRFYERMLVKILRQTAAERAAFFPELPAIPLPRHLTLAGFDEIFTAPLCGFESARDYYAKASAGPLLARIAADTRILHAIDDPIVDAAALERDDLPASVRVVLTERGGHLGFLGMPGSPGGFRWMDAMLLEWLEPQAQ